jgi:hypothetical protein
VVDTADGAAGAGVVVVAAPPSSPRPTLPLAPRLAELATSTVA